ncbi:MAG: nickel pincer cofactor biosynthesis protein LarC [Actinobacteria bacterium]|nr:nickel pincer cofactor biosynthesis protein LarC [Actinomycetota bacterium]
MTSHLQEQHLKAQERIAWFHCFSGVAGDMAFASLLDAGADLGEVRDILNRLQIGEWSLEIEPVLRCGIAATRAVVRATEGGPERTFEHISSLLKGAKLPSRVLERAMAAFSLLASVEGRLHRKDPKAVRFHEVGGHDAIVEIVGTAAALEVLEISEISSSPIAVGSGVISSSHGLIPNPSPAASLLLRGVPAIGRDAPIELTTPTGAAILASLSSSFGPLPMMTVERSGFGAGLAELEGLPNCTQVVIGSSMSSEGEARMEDLGQPQVLMETNLDDVTGETLSYTLSKVLDAGAADAWITSVVMKKGRPGHILSILCDVADVRGLRDLVISETGTLGVRLRTINRWAEPRTVEEVAVGNHRVRVKMSTASSGRSVRIKAEHEDAARLAELSSMPLREAASLAEQAIRASLNATEERPKQ